MFKEGITKDMMNSLRDSDDIKNYIEQQKKFMNEKQLHEYLNIILNVKNISKSNLIKRADIERTYGYEILRGDKTPRRDVVLRLLIACKMSIDDIQHILKNTEYPILYPKNQRDAAILFCINEGYDLFKCNKVLFDLDMEIL